MFHKFCVLSLAYRSDGFVTMLAPIRNYFSPRDPASAPLLCSTGDRYFDRLWIDVRPGQPGSEEARWIASEDVNVEHLLDVFTTADPTSEAVWGSCVNFMIHLFWYKPRLVMLGRKIEALADDHPSKLECLFQFSQLFQRVGNFAESKRLLTHALKLTREQGNDHQLAHTLNCLSNVHFSTDQCEEGIRVAKEASEIYERLGDTVQQALCLASLASLLHRDGQLDAAEEIASRAIDLFSQKGEQFQVCHCHQVLGDIYRSKGEIGKAIYHLEVSLEIASSSDWPSLLLHAHSALARLFVDGGRFDEVHTHVEHAKLHAANSNDIYCLALLMRDQAQFWYRQHRFEEAKSEALCALDAFEKLGATDLAEGVRGFLRWIERGEEID